MTEESEVRYIGSTGAPRDEAIHLTQQFELLRLADPRSITAKLEEIMLETAVHSM
jgi:hypothetical protein